jgi:PKD repeat protein
MSELESMLREQIISLGKDPDRVVSAAPTGDENKVIDLDAIPVSFTVPASGNGVPAVGVLLEWTERLAGDYDENGLVTINDISPFGLTWQQSLQYVDPRGEGVKWPSADGTSPAQPYDPIWRLARVDGEPNGLITLGDLAPIAKHFGESVSGYRVYRKAPGDIGYLLLTDALFTTITPDDLEGKVSIPREATHAAGTAGPDKDFGVHYAFFDQSVPGPGDYEYAVAPYDEATDAEGPLSFVFNVTYPATPAPVPDPGTQAPEVTLSTLGSTSGDAPFTISFIAQPLSHATEIEALLWDFESDGVIDQATGRNTTAEHTYGAPGQVTATVYAVEPGGRSASGQLAIDVLDQGNSLPTAVAAADPISGPAPLLVTFDGSGSTDKEGIQFYEWDPEGDGTFLGKSPLPTASFTLPEGEYDSVLQITDLAGAIATASVHISVGPIDSDPPVVTIDASIPPDTYAPASIDFTFTLDDPEDGPMTLEIDWDNDGLFDSTELVVDGQVVRSQLFSDFGAHTVAARLTDDHGLTGSDTFDFTLLENHPPVAQLAADIDFGTAPLTVSFDASASSDPDGQPLTYYWSFQGPGNYIGPLTAQEVFTYYTFGIRGAWVRVVDSEGLSAETAVSIQTTSGWEIRKILNAGSGSGFGDPEVSLAIIAGNPAVAYVRDGNVYYARSDNVKGTFWSTAVLVDAPGFGAGEPTLKTVNGRPAIAFLSGAGDVLFSSALDANGNSWNPEVQVAFTSGSGSATDMEIVNGQPAISWIDSLGNLRYVRALDSDGVLWGTPHDFGANGSFIFSEEIDLDIVANNPALVACNGTSVNYYRALDNDGTLWNTAQSVHSGGELQKSAAMYVPPGLPAGLPVVLYLTDAGTFARQANDVAGLSWTAAAQASAVNSFDYKAGFIGAELEVKAIGGVPATVDLEGNFFFSSDAFGAGWEPRNGIGDLPIFLDSYDLAEVNGAAGVAFETSAGLHFARLR